LLDVRQLAVLFLDVRLMQAGATLSLQGLQMKTRKKGADVVLLFSL